MESLLIVPIIESLDLEYCKNKPVVIKGCSETSQETLTLN